MNGRALAAGFIGTFALIFIGAGPVVVSGELLVAALAHGLVVEVILTFVLVNAIFNTAVNGKAGNLAPLAIGMTLTAVILMGGPLTGASLNPPGRWGRPLSPENLPISGSASLAPRLGQSWRLCSIRIF